MSSRPLPCRADAAPLRAPRAMNPSQSIQARQPVFVNFNQDCTCLCIAHGAGINVFSLDASRTVFTAALGAIRICHMLYSTSLLAYVGAGEQPQLTPRKLFLLNTTTQKTIQDLTFPSSVLAIRINRKRLVSVLEQKTLVYALESLELLGSIDTPDNKEGVCALTVTSAPCYLALPAGAKNGSVRVYDYAEHRNVVAEVAAHQSRVAALAWNEDGSLLASASSKGTIIRVHHLPQATEVHAFRRGTSQAKIHCLAFSVQGVSPQLLACASSHGTVHVWMLNGATSSYASVLASVMPGPMSALVDTPRSAISLRIPKGIPIACAILKKRRVSSSQVLGEREAAEEDTVILLAATDRACLYAYQINSLAPHSQPTLILDDECALL